MTFIITTARTPYVTYYAVFLSFSFVLDTVQAPCKDVAWSVIHSKCTSNHSTSHHTTSITSHHTKSHHTTSHHITSHHTTSITSHHITPHHITSLLTLLHCIGFGILNSLRILLLQMSSNLSICLTSFLSSLPSFLPSFPSSSIPAFCLSPCPLL